MRAVLKHRGDTYDNAVSFVLRAVSKNTGLIPSNVLIAGPDKTT